MDYLRPKRGRYPYDTDLIDKDIAEYLNRLVKRLEITYQDAWTAFRRVENHLNLLLDLNDGFFEPPRESADAEPTLSAGEMKIWRDSDDNKVFLVYNDADEGQKKVELI